MIGDRIGRKRMLIIGMALFGLASLISSYAQTPGQLIWARAAMGLGGAAVMPQTLSIITNVFEPRGAAARPSASGPAAVGVAIAIGPITGGLLLDHFWWGSVFLINVPLDRRRRGRDRRCSCPSRKSPSPGRIDYLGVLLSIVGLVLLVYGIIKGGDAGSWLERGVLGPIVGGLAVLAGILRARVANRASVPRRQAVPRPAAVSGRGGHRRWSSSRWRACTSS